MWRKQLSSKFPFQFGNAFDYIVFNKPGMVLGAFKQMIYDTHLCNACSHDCFLSNQKKRKQFPKIDDEILEVGGGSKPKPKYTNFLWLINDEFVMGILMEIFHVLSYNFSCKFGC